MTKVIYTGFFVNQEEVLEKFPVDTEKYPNVFAHHCTSIFKPTDEEVTEFKNTYSEILQSSEEETMIEVIGRVQTDKVDALLIGCGIYSNNKYRHITLATAEGVKPFESNAEILKLAETHEGFNSSADEMIKLNMYCEGYLTGFHGLYTSDNKVRRIGQAVIVDIDRTLCNITENGRSPYDWDRVAEDEPIEAMCQLVRGLREKYHIVLLTGRSEDAREGTEKWLEEQDISYDKLLMKASGSYEKSTLTKYESYVNDIKDEYDVAFAIDDDQRVVDMWSENGILCLKV